MKNQFVLLHILFFFFCSEQGCLWLGLVFFQGGDWCGKIQIIKVKFWKFVFCLLFVPHHLSSLVFVLFLSFFLSSLRTKKYITLKFQNAQPMWKFLYNGREQWMKQKSKKSWPIFHLFCLFVAVWRCKKFVCFDFLKTFHVPNTKSLCGGWWFQLLMNWQLASKKQL